MKCNVCGAPVKDKKCTYCGKTFSDEEVQQYLHDEEMNRRHEELLKQNKRLREKNWFIILMLIFFFPVGLYLMWKYAEWHKIVKIVVTLIFVIYICKVRLHIPGLRSSHQYDEYSTFTWPDSQIASFLPKPNRLYGRIEKDNKDELIIVIANSNQKIFDDYVKKCKDEDFNDDYNRTDKTYVAENSDSYKLSVFYTDYNDEMTIKIESPYKEDELESDEDKKTEKTKKTETKKSSKKSTSQLNPKFKAAMDEYEKFFDKYIAFMKKYKNSSDTSSMLKDYSKYMDQYSKTMDKMNDLDDGSLNEKEADYYLKVTTRINKKLSDI